MAARESHTEGLISCILAQNPLWPHARLPTSDFLFLRHSAELFPNSCFSGGIMGSRSRQD